MSGYRNLQKLEFQSLSLESLMIRNSRSFSDMQTKQYANAIEGSTPRHSLT